MSQLLNVDSICSTVAFNLKVILHSNKLFNIMKPEGQGKKETLLSSEFGKNLKLYFGKVSDQQDQQVDTVDLFRKALKSVKK